MLPYEYKGEDNFNCKDLLGNYTEDNNSGCHLLSTYNIPSPLHSLSNSVFTTALWSGTTAPIILKIRNLWLRQTDLPKVTWLIKGKLAFQTPKPKILNIIVVDKDNLPILKATHNQKNF